MEDETKEKYMVRGEKNKKVHKKKGELCNVINQLPMCPSGENGAIKTTSNCIHL